jgi:hypothetical protein
MLQFGLGTGLVNAFTVDVAKLFATNSGTVNANFKVRVLAI